MASIHQIADRVVDEERHELRRKLRAIERLLENEEWPTLIDADEYVVIPTDLLMQLQEIIDQ